MKDDEKLAILMHEYDGIRAEIRERIKLAYQLLGWAGAAFAFLLPFATANASTAVRSTGSSSRSSSSPPSASVRWSGSPY